MNANLDQLKLDLNALSVPDRAELIEHLIRSLDSEVDEDAETAWMIEIERRVRRTLSGESPGEPAEQVFAEMRAKFQ